MLLHYQTQRLYCNMSRICGYRIAKKEVELERGLQLACLACHSGEHYLLRNENPLERLRLTTY